VVDPGRLAERGYRKFNVIHSLVEGLVCFSSHRTQRVIVVGKEL